MTYVIYEGIGKTQLHARHCLDCGKPLSHHKHRGKKATRCNSCNMRHIQKTRRNSK